VTSQALVHDFFVAEGGAEQCAIEFANMLPRARIYTSFFDSSRFGDRIDPDRVHRWPLSRVADAPGAFRSFFPLYAAYFGALHVDADLVISSSIAFTKAVRTRPDACHISYVYTPMRYAWDLGTYLAGSSYPLPARLGALAMRPLMRAWDRRTARRPDIIVAISQTVRSRIESVWRRAVDEVIYPPVPVTDIPLGTADDGYLLVAARLLAYRRVDLAVEACTRLGRELIVVGDGPERGRLEAMAGPTVRFAGHVTRSRLVDLYRGCHAYLLPGIEDFGIAPVEAMAAGKPVVAFAGGGALETVVPGVTGVHCSEATPDAFADAIQSLERLPVNPTTIRTQAERFGSDVFRDRWRSLLKDTGFAGALGGTASHPPA
jgi:glycosyltransferase involved in cell wall biosynthesis